MGRKIWGREARVGGDAPQVQISHSLQRVAGPIEGGRSKFSNWQYTYTYIPMHVYIHIHMCIDMYRFMYLHIYIYIYIYIFIYI